MKKVLIIESSVKMEGLYFLNLKAYLNLEPITKKNAQFALSEINESISLIVMRERIGEELTAKKVIHYLNNNKLSIPLIIIGSNHIEKENLIQLQSSTELRPLLKAASLLLKITPQDMLKEVVPEYYPIPINYFKELKIAATNIYSNLDGFELEIKKDENIDNISNLIALGNSILYILKNDRLKFINSLTKEIVSNVSIEEVTEGDRVVTGSAQLFELADKLEALGITRETIELTDAQLNNIMTTVKRVTKINQLLKTLRKNKTSYLFKHVQLLTYVSVHLVEKMGIVNKRQNIEKMAFCSLFHDIILSKDKYALISTEEELNMEDLTRDERVLVKNHANLAADLIKDIPNLPPDVETIIR
jgi:HD-GYP domain-containing protein (c-di-GMP phosphodiesterase class II)